MYWKLDANSIVSYHLNKPTHILNSVDSSLLLGEKPKSTIAKDLANENSIKNRILANHAGGTTTLNINGRDVDMKPYIEEAKKFVAYLSSEDTIKYFTQTGLIVPARIDVSKTIDNKVFLDAIKKSKAINYGKDYRKKTDEMNKKLF